MTARLIDGVAVATISRMRTAARVTAFAARHGRAPALATVLVGSDPASEVYVRRKRAQAVAAGFVDVHRHLPGDAAQRDVAAVIDELGSDDQVSGILLQLPLPRELDRSRLIDRIPSGKDVDGLTTTNRGLLARGRTAPRPCTPAGILELLDDAGIELDGAHAVVVGRSELVGHPMAELLVQRNATTTIAHSHTRDLAAVTRQADVLIAAAGVAGLIGAPHVRPGAAVIDVGMHRTPSGLAGDVRSAEVVEIASWLTPVPGGVGPMTIAVLLANTIEAAEAAVARKAHA